jgi:hypothetical protein
MHIALAIVFVISVTFPADVHALDAQTVINSHFHLELRYRQRPMPPCDSKKKDLFKKSNERKKIRVLSDGLVKLAV